MYGLFHFEDFLMTKKPTYEELEQRIKRLENEAFERKQAEAVLKEKELKLRVSEQALKSILRNLPDIIYRLDPKGAITYVNDTVKEYGYSKEELIGKNILEFIHPDDREKAAYRVNERRAGERSTKLFEIRFLRKKLGYVHFENKSRGFEDVLINAEGIYTSEKPGMKTFMGTQGIARDIFERKQVEETLRESEKQYRSLMNNLPVAVYRTTPGPEGKFLMVNPAFCNLFGFKNEEAVKKMSVSDFHANPEERKQLSDEIMEHGIVENHERILLKRDGTPVHTSTTARVVGWKNGGGIYFDCILIDVTERKRSDEALKRRTHDLGKRVKELNCLYGISNLVEKPDISLYEIIQSVAELIPPSWQYPEITCARILLEDKEYKTENFEETNWTQSSDILVNGKRAGVLEVYYLEERPEIDEGPFLKEEESLIKVITERLGHIAERMQAEEVLRESEERFRLTFTTSPDAINVNLLENGVYVDVNDGFTQLTGYTRGDVIGRTPLEINIWDDPGNRERFVNSLRERGYYKNFEGQFRMKDGSLITGLMSARVLSLKGVPHIISITRDINNLKEAEASKQELQAQLHRSQKMEALGTLAGGVAHDLNNILGGLVSYPELLLLQLPEDSPLRKSILTIQKSGEKAASVVQDLLTLARRGVVVNDVINPNDVISEYLESPEHEKLQSYHPGVQIETHLEKDTLNILGSSTHFSKTVMNLVSNAAEAMPEGGKLTVSTGNRYIDKPISGYAGVKEGDYVVLTISDTGTGISPDDIEKIFEPFYTKKKMGRSGTGLGMAVVWGTVKDHNGYIDIQSTEGKGTTFTLYFPVTRKTLPEDKSLLAIESYSGKGESILIIDDVEEQRNIASGMLKELGYLVVSVSGGEEAVEYLKTNKADLLLLDMIMDPGMDGLNTYKKILEIHPGQKAIIASGFSETERVKEVQNLGAGAYIRKPLLLEKIGLAVKEELEK